jgi:predicted DNA-binding transcriptional regulator YafY
MADRVERLTNLLALLLETPEPLSLVAIAGALHGQYPEGTSALRGAFERDKAALRDIGVPIEQEVVTGGQYAGQTRYWIDRDRYELADLQLDDDEVRAIQVAVAATRSGSGLGQEAIWKLGGAVADHALPVAATMPSLPELPTIRDAVARRAVVTFRYRDVDRDVEPHGLLLREGFWYLVGFDRVRGERRTFRVDRIDGGLTAGRSGAFERPSRVDVDAVAHWDPKVGDEGDRVDAVVRVDALRAAAVVREVGEDRVVRRRRDGAVDVRVPAGNVDAFRSWVLGLLEHAEVLEPASVRADVVAWLSAIGVGA